MIFIYGYGCCAFTHNIYGSQPVVPEEMPNTSKPLSLKEKKALEEAYEEGFDVIFNYGYGCCAFTHNICGSQPVVQDGMPNISRSLSLEFFINP